MRSLICRIFGHVPFKLGKVAIIHEGKRVGWYFPMTCVKCWRILPNAELKRSP